MALPSGNVTFLFTDLEDSTRLWERHGEAMRDALLRHDSIMQDAIDAHGGALVKHTGDGVCAVFPEAREAAAACITAQRALVPASEGDVVLRSRMAIYTGVAELQGSDYRGTVLNRAARLMAAAHGGQVLVSQSARAAIGADLPPGVHLRDLGLRRLRDVPEPEQVFQLVADGLRSEFPPVRTLDVRKLDVPSPATGLVGREREIAVAAQAFRAATTRLVTLTGPGGTGKSRLAIELARRLVDDYADGAVFVPLAAIEKADALPHAIAQALDVREPPGAALTQALCASIRDKNLLLVLDNFEQIVDAAPLVSTLLEAAPRLHVLVTSRERLHISGEREHDLAPLVQDDAVALFMARAQAVEADLRLEPGNARDIAAICARLDGLPLAIELAAARVRVLPLSRIRAELDESLRFLVGGARNLPERHRTLRATIDWSFRLLSAPEQALFRRFAVFVDGASLEAVEAVCGQGEDAVLALESLVAKSLVRSVHGAETRFSMLETIREFALERLNESGERAAIEEAHAAHFAHIADELHRHRRDPTDIEWIRRLDRDHENLRSALELTASTANAGRGFRMCKSLFAFWTTRGYLAEGRRWCTRMLELPREGASEFDRLATVHALAVLAARQGDYEAARPLFEQSAAALRANGHLEAAGNALNNLGNLLLHTGDLAGARRAYEDSLALKRQLGAPIGMTLSNLADVLSEAGNFAGARSLLEEALERGRAGGDLRGTASALNSLAGADLRLGDREAARARSDEALAIFRQLDAKGQIAETLALRGAVALGDADLELARKCYAEALDVAIEIGDRRAAALALESFARLAIAMGEALVAARNLGAARRIREEIKMPQGGDPESIVGDARALCGDEAAFEEAWRAGLNAPLESAAEFALRHAGR